jgi:acyl-CoA thioesterase
MSDSYFIGTVARVHNVRRFSSPAALQRMLKGVDPANPDSEVMRQYLTSLADEEDAELQANADGSSHVGEELGMIASLDHSIFFHNPTDFRADEWMLMEMDTPWAGDGRGLVIQKIWSHDGTLIATCTQEVRDNLLLYDVNGCSFNG